MKTGCRCRRRNPLRAADCRKEFGKCMGAGNKDVSGRDQRDPRDHYLARIDAIQQPSDHQPERARGQRRGGETRGQPCAGPSEMLQTGVKKTAPVLAPPPHTKNQQTNSTPTTSHAPGASFCSSMIPDRSKRECTAFAGRSGMLCPLRPPNQTIRRGKPRSSAALCLLRFPASVLDLSKQTEQIVQ